MTASWVPRSTETQWTAQDPSLVSMEVNLGAQPLCPHGHLALMLL